MNSRDCVIVGGGVIGLSLAWELAREGMKVCVVDRQRVGQGASWAGVGVLPPANFETALDPIDRLRGLSHQLHPIWSDLLLNATGIDNGYRKCGGIYLAMSRGEAASLTGLIDYWHEYRIESHDLSSKQLTNLEPELSAGIVKNHLKAILLPDEAQIRSPDHMRALRVACQNSSVEIIEDCQTSSFALAGDRILGIQTSSGLLEGDRFCVANGAWSSLLLGELDCDSAVIPIRGQVILYRLVLPAIGRVINEGNRYMVARDDGHLLVGSNEEEVGFADGTTSVVVDELKGWAESILPSIKDKQIKRRWSGFRPASYDGFPYIGRIPRFSNGYMATGHYRSGLHLSCATATELASMILQRDMKIDLSAFAPQRT